MSFNKRLDLTGKAIADLIAARPAANELDVKLLRGQGYDESGNMVGKDQGVQAGMRKLQPKALYTQCYSYFMNQVPKNSMKPNDQENFMRTFIMYLNEASQFFRTAQRNRYLDERLRCHKLKPDAVCKTRWI